MIFNHGKGEAGTDGKALLNTGLPYVLNNGFTPPYDIIMIAAQRSSWSVDVAWLPYILSESVRRWSVDTTHVYITGLSAGGWATAGSQLNIDQAFGAKFAAVVGCSLAPQDANSANMPWWGINKTPFLDVTGDADSLYYANRDLVDAVNNVSPKTAILVTRPGVGHGGWNQVYDGTIKEPSGKSMWEWMIQFHR